MKYPRLTSFVAPALLLASSACLAQEIAPATPREAAIEQLADDPAAALAAATRQRDAAIAAWPTTQVADLVDAVEHHAIVAMIGDLPASARSLMLDVWASHPEFVGALARVITDTNDGSSVATIAQAIAVGQPDALSDYPELAAAVCVVLDRPREYPGLGSILPAAPDVFEALVFAHQDRRVMALPLDRLPAEVLTFMTDSALTGEGIRTIIQDRRQREPLELYRLVTYRQASLLEGEAALPPEEFSFERIQERGGLGPLRSFYAEQLGQAFGYPVALATGHLGDERFLAPVFLEQGRRGYLWNLDAIADHAGLAFGATQHPVTNEPLPLAELLLTADLAEAGPASTRTAWALHEATQSAAPSVRPGLISATVDATPGFADAWRAWLVLQLEQASGEPDGVQRVLTDFFGRLDRRSPLFATRTALDAIAEMDDDQLAVLEWLSLTARRDPHRYAAAQLALGDLLLSQGDRAAASKAYEDLVNRQADETPLALDAISRLDTMFTQDGRADELLSFYGRTHRRFRAPRTSQEAEVRASGFMVVGERYEALLRAAGRDREADRLRRQLDRAIP
ncbi:MAG: hypothetical protein RIE77_12390 [Phycisphaerales bacterium]|jgi:tetratricopeptide (TPR) repeat protein